MSLVEHILFRVDDTCLQQWINIDPSEETGIFLLKLCGVTYIPPSFLAMSLSLSSMECIIAACSIPKQDIP